MFYKHIKPNPVVFFYHRWKFVFFAINKKYINLNVCLRFVLIKKTIWAIFPSTFITKFLEVLISTRDSIGRTRDKVRQINLAWIFKFAFCCSYGRKQVRSLFYNLLVHDPCKCLRALTHLLLSTALTRRFIQHRCIFVAAHYYYYYYYNSVLTELLNASADINRAHKLNTELGNAETNGFRSDV